MAHCDQGEDEGCCKYGEDDICPALVTVDRPAPLPAPPAPRYPAPHPSSLSPVPPIRPRMIPAATDRPSYRTRPIPALLPRCPICDARAWRQAGDSMFICTRCGRGQAYQPADPLPPLPVRRPQTLLDYALMIAACLGAIGATWLAVTWR